MPVCTKCNIDKPIEEYSLDKQKKKVYRKRYCKDCFRKQSREWKQKNKMKTQQEPVPVIPDDWKKCSECMEYKSLDQYYLSHAGNPVRMCKPCYKKYHRDKVEKEYEENGGPSTYSKFPNEYTSEHQRKQVFQLMEALGWIFDESTGIWNKIGLKENGVFINFTPTVKKKRHNGPPHGRKIKSGVWNNREKIIKLIEEGHDYFDVAYTYDCSHTTIRKVISEYRNGKKP